MTVEELPRTGHPGNPPLSLDGPRHLEPDRGSYFVALTTGE